MKEAIAKANDVVDGMTGESKSDIQSLPECNPIQPTLSVFTSPAGANDKKPFKELKELKVQCTKLRDH